MMPRGTKSRHSVLPAPSRRKAALADLNGFMAAPQELCLVVIKTAHTFVWLIFAGSILAIPIVAMTSRFPLAAALSGLVLVECAVLGLNRGRCPLTDLAARYTENRAYNFDIYLPRWLARYNKQIFGTLFVLGELLVVWRWMIFMR
jgi:hypothetical protein